MTNSSKFQVSSERQISFLDIAKPDRLPRLRKRRLSPLSIRLTIDERMDLLARAGDMSVSAYAKGLLFAASAKPSRLRPRHPHLDHQILAQVLAALGRSEIAPDLATLAEAARLGAVPADDITLAQIERTCTDVTWMRGQLMQALGCRS